MRTHLSGSPDGTGQVDEGATQPPPNLHDPRSSQERLGACLCPVPEARESVGRSQEPPAVHVVDAH